MTTNHSGFLLAPTRMTLNDPECWIQLKVRFTDGPFDVRMLWTWPNFSKVEKHNTWHGVDHKVKTFDLRNRTWIWRSWTWSSNSDFQRQSRGHTRSVQSPIDYKKLSYRRETARQLRMSFSARSLIAHFTEHRISCINRNSHTRFQLVPKLSTFDDLERP